MKAFLIVFTLIAVAISSWTYRANRQRQAVAWVTSNGGQVLYTFDRETAGVVGDGWYVSNEPLPVPRFLKGFLDVHYFSTATLVNFPEADDLDLSPIQSLVSMDTLIIENSETADFSPLRKHPTLSNLVITNSPIDNLAQLNDIPMLDSLTLDGIPATDLTPVCNIESLKLLHIRNCHFADCECLAKLQSLQFLWFENTPFVNLDPIRGMKLRHLGLDRTGTTDLTPISSQLHLESIHLTKIDSTDITPLKQLHGVNAVLISDSPFSDNDIDDLRLSLPNCKIDYYPQSKLNGG